MPYYMHKKDRNQANHTLPDENGFRLPWQNGMPQAPAVQPPLRPGMQDPAASSAGSPAGMPGQTGDISPEMWELLAQQAGVPVSELQTQLERAQALRARAGPEGMTAGGVYQAANPLSHLAEGIGKFRAGRAERRLPGEITEAREARGEKLTAYSDLLRKRWGE